MVRQGLEKCLLVILRNVLVAGDGGHWRFLVVLLLAGGFLHEVDVVLNICLSLPI
jgi:hypothetical protein